MITKEEQDASDFCELCLKVMPELRGREVRDQYGNILGFAGVGITDEGKAKLMDTK